MLEMFGSPRGRRLLAGGAVLGAALLLVLRPPIRSSPAGEVGVRINRLTGGIACCARGRRWSLPLACTSCAAIRCATRSTGRPRARRADGAAPFQTVEGLSVGVDVTVRYALDPRAGRRDGQAAAGQRRAPS